MQMRMAVGQIRGGTTMNDRRSDIFQQFDDAHELPTQIDCDINKNVLSVIQETGAVHILMTHLVGSTASDVAATQLWAKVIEMCLKLRNDGHLPCWSKALQMLAATEAAFI